VIPKSIRMKPACDSRRFLPSALALTGGRAAGPDDKRPAGNALGEGWQKAPL